MNVYAINCDTEGDFFGELALLNDEPRAATVLAESDVTCLKLDRTTFCDILGPLRQVSLYEYYC